MGSQNNAHKTTTNQNHTLQATQQYPLAQLTWTLARNLWPHDNIPWPNINLGTILGSGCISLPLTQRQRDDNEQNGSGALNSTDQPDSCKSSSPNWRT